MPRFLRFRIIAALALLVGVATATAQPIVRVYRVDSRPPQVMFPFGFDGRGQRTDVLAHAIGGSCNAPDPADASAWVSTTRDLGMAEDFAWHNLRAMAERLVPDPVVWIYTIRPDHDYVSVASLVQQAIHEGELSAGSVYTPDHARTLRWLRARAPIVREGEVITRRIHTGNLVEATPMRIVGNTLVAGTPVPNAMYLPLDTTALPAVNDLPNFIPPASIHMHYFDDSDSDSDGSCSLSCDRSTSSSGFLMERAAIDSGYCAARSKQFISPLLYQIILD